MALRPRFAQRETADESLEIDRVAHGMRCMGYGVTRISLHSDPSLFIPYPLLSSHGRRCNRISKVTVIFCGLDITPHSSQSWARTRRNLILILSIPTISSTLTQLISVLILLSNTFYIQPSGRSYKSFSEEPFDTDPANPIVPCWEVLEYPGRGPSSPDGLLITPLLREFNSPDFETVGDFVEFMGQLLEGLVFMHDHNISHGNIKESSIKMGAPDWAFSLQYPNLAPSHAEYAKIGTRSDLASVGYWFVRFRGARRWPERSSGDPLNPEQLEAYERDKYTRLDFLRWLALDMRSPVLPISAQTALERFRAIRLTLTNETRAEKVHWNVLVDGPKLLKDRLLILLGFD